MSKITELMIRKPSLKYRDVRNYEGEYCDMCLVGGMPDYVFTENKKLYLNGMTRQLQNEAPATDVPALYFCESDAPKASFYLPITEETSFIGYHRKTIGKRG